MKKHKSRIMTLLLASALSVAAIGGATYFASADDGDGYTYTPSRIFTAENSATVDEESSGSENMAFTFRSGSSVSFKRDLALKWYAKDKESDEVEVKYLSMRFAFNDTDFSRINLTFEASPATALKDKKATNKLVFEKSEEKILVSVNDGEEKTETDVSGDIVLSLSEKDGETLAGEGEFFVFLNGVKVGIFENIGDNFAEYFSASATTPMVPFAFTAEFPEGTEDSVSTTIIFKELNGQDFALKGGKIKDTAAPVLVVNDEITGFMLGMPFSLDYEVIDVLDTSVTKTMEYYQYNPTDEEMKYKTLSTSTYFFDTVYKTGEGADERTLSVYEQEGMEFVSVKFTLADDDHTGENAEDYYLAWYAEEKFRPEKTEHAETLDVDYIRVNRNEEGPGYTGLENVENEKGEMITRRTEEGEAQFEAYQTKVTEAAEDVYAGSNSYVYLPSFRGLIGDDDTGYKNLKFSIYYKTSNSDSASSSTNLSSDELRIAVSSVGMYEFKVLATDKAGNSMYYYLDGHKTKVTSDTIWDIEAIPSFTFSVSNNGLSVEENKDGADTGYIDVTYTSSDFTVTGVGTPDSENALYFFDKIAFQQKYSSVSVSTDDLAAITFKALKDAAAADTSSDKADKLKKDAIGYFAELYAELLTEHLGLDSVTAEDLLNPAEDGKAILRQIAEYDSTIDEDDHPKEWKESDNAFHWSSSSKSFKPQESGAYLVLTVYTDSELFGEKACAYRVVNVEARSDVIRGETEWLKNNIASVILFSVAAVLFVIVIILWFVKPSDESLEDVDDGKKTKKSKKAGKKSK